MKVFVCKTHILTPVIPYALLSLLLFSPGVNVISTNKPAKPQTGIPITNHQNQKKKIRISN